MIMLLIDAGNSRLKWAMVKDEECLGTNTRSSQNVLDNEQVTRSIFADLPPPDHVIISNVAGSTMKQILLDACAGWSCKIKFVTARQRQCGVLNTYLLSDQLGSDRWAALIAAWQRQRNPCLVVNCGTATTIDTLIVDGGLSESGIFLGGLILPGVNMMQSSLTHNTAQLLKMKGSLRDFPQNTADAIHSGSVRATLGAIHQQYAKLVKYLNDQTISGDETEKQSGRTAPPLLPRCLLSGGAAHLIQPHLIGLETEHIPDLVLRGLQIIGQDWIAL